MKTFAKIFTFFACLISCLTVQSQALSEVDGDIVIPSDNDYMYGTPKSKYMSVSFNAFNSREPDRFDFVYDSPSKPYRFFRNGNSNFGYANAPIYLPDGAIISELRGWLYDNDINELVRLRIYRAELGSSTNPLAVATIATDEAGAGTTVQELSTTFFANGGEIIDNSTYAYFLEFEAGATNTEELRLYGARIAYTVEKVD